MENKETEESYASMENEKLHNQIQELSQKKVALEEDIATLKKMVAHAQENEERMKIKLDEALKSAAEFRLQNETI